MKKYLKFGVCLLIVALFVTGCSGKNGQVDQNVGQIAEGTDESLSPEIQEAIETEKDALEETEQKEESKPQETSAPDISENTEQTPESDVSVDGTLIWHSDSASMIMSTNSAEGWIILYDMDGKGYGTPYNAVHPETGMIIKGAEGAEVYFCPDGILQLEWRYQGSGSPAMADIVLLYYPQINGDPKTFDLYLNKYDFDGNLLSEVFVMSYTQSEEYPGAQISEAVTPVLEQYGAITDYYEQTYYPFVDENGDAVAYDENGNEMIRYPGDGANAQGMSLYMNEEDKLANVSYMFYPTFTDIYKMN